MHLLYTHKMDMLQWENVYYTLYSISTMEEYTCYDGYTLYIKVKSNAHHWNAYKLLKRKSNKNFLKKEEINQNQQKKPNNIWKN